MTQLLDGYPGHEHSLPIYPIYSDVVKTIAEAKMAVTPTLLVSYGGPWAENFYYATENVWETPNFNSIPLMKNWLPSPDEDQDGLWRKSTSLKSMQNS